MLLRFTSKGLKRFWVKLELSDDTVLHSTREHFEVFLINNQIEQGRSVEDMQIQVSQVT